MPYPETDIDGHPWPQPDLGPVIEVEVTRDIEAGEEITLDVHPGRRPRLVRIDQDQAANEVAERWPAQINANDHPQVQYVGEWGVRAEATPNPFPNARVREAHDALVALNPTAVFGFDSYNAMTDEQRAKNIVDQNPEATLRELFTKTLDYLSRGDYSHDQVALHLVEVLNAAENRQET